MGFRAKPQDGPAWVTGASSGIGQATALELARRGFHVIASARRMPDLLSLAAQAESLPGRITPHPLDVTDRQAIAEAVKTIETEHGAPALVFLNAGIAPYTRAQTLDADAFRQAFAVNVFGVVDALSALLPGMVAAGRGQIAVNGSIAGYGGLPRAAAYGASKAAVIHLCEALKFDCDSAGVTMQVVNPGFIDTPLTRKNDFPMPFLMPMDEAARRVVDGFERGGFEITFPRRLAFILKAVNLLPYKLYFPLVARFTGQSRR